MFTPIVVLYRQLVNAIKNKEDMMQDVSRPIVQRSSLKKMGKIRGKIKKQIARETKVHMPNPAKQVTLCTTCNPKGLNTTNISTTAKDVILMIASSVLISEIRG